MEGKGVSGTYMDSSLDEYPKFYAELRPGVTTTVSWKKLLKEIEEKRKQCPCAMEHSTRVVHSAEEAPRVVHSVQEAPRAVDSAQVAPRRVMDKKSDAVKSKIKPSKLFDKNEMLEKMSRAAWSGSQQCSKRQTDLRNDDDATNNNPSTCKKGTTENLRKAIAETAPLLEKSLTHFQVSYGSKYSKRQRNEASLLQDCEGKITTASLLSHAKHQNADRAISKKLVCDKNEVEVRKKSDKGKTVVCYPQQVLEISASVAVPVSDVSTVRPNSSLLERAIRDLEGTVAECSFKIEVPDSENSTLAIKNRLPSEVRHKLAEVVRIAQSGQDTRLGELLNRLVSILGQLVEGKILKRNLREIVTLGFLSTELKSDRSRQIEKELLAMLETQRNLRELVMLQLSSNHGGPGDSQQTKNELLAEKKNELFTMIGAQGVENILGLAVDDKINELYELHQQGLVRDKFRQTLKFFDELAALWPEGVMDYQGLRNAISRSNKRQWLQDCQNQRNLRLMGALGSSLKSVEPNKTQPMRNEQDPKADETNNLVRSGGEGNLVAAAGSVTQLEKRATTSCNLASGLHSVATMDRHPAAPVRKSSPHGSGLTLKFSRQGDGGKMVIQQVTRKWKDNPEITTQANRTSNQGAQIKPHHQLPPGFL